MGWIWRYSSRFEIVSRVTLNVVDAAVESFFEWTARLELLEITVVCVPLGYDCRKANFAGLTDWFWAAYIRPAAVCCCLLIYCLLIYWPSPSQLAWCAAAALPQTNEFKFKVGNFGQKRNLDGDVFGRNLAIVVLLETQCSSNNKDNVWRRMGLFAQKLFWNKAVTRRAGRDIQDRKRSAQRRSLELSIHDGW